jgi:hypothetical protein
MPRHYDLNITLPELQRLLYTGSRRAYRRGMKPHPQVCGLHTFEIYQVNELFPYLGKGMEKLPVLHRGCVVEVGTASHRLACFKRSRVCVRCGKVGTIFLLQAYRIAPYLKQSEGMEKPHFNLYHIDDAGHFHLMTQDHIHPRSKGGPDTLANLQTMCSDCNNQKGATLE